MATLQGTIIEKGNGFPRSGQYVTGGDGEIYRVVTMANNISTGDVRGNSVGATVEKADRSDCPEGEEHSAIFEADEPTKHGRTYAEWLREARPDGDYTSQYDLRAAWSAGEEPSEYTR